MQRLVYVPDAGAFSCGKESYLRRAPQYQAVSRNGCAQFHILLKCVLPRNTRKPCEVSPPNPGAALLPQARGSKPFQRSGAKCRRTLESKSPLAESERKT